MQPLHLVTTFLLLASPPALWAQSPVAAGASFQIDYDPTKALGGDDVETLANVAYPPAKGPLSHGYPPEALPVFLNVRGGNSNSLVPGVADQIESQTMMADLGMVALTFNLPTVEPGEDYRASLVGVQRMVQFLRANALEYNLDPARIVMHGRSMGTFLSYATCFKEDLADPASSDPVAQQSSRPDYLIARLGISSLMCFNLAPGPWSTTISSLVFPNASLADATPAERLAESPAWWLLNPGLFGRDFTPPIFVIYNSAHGDICGEVDDVHSGFLGEEMMRAIDAFADQSGDERFRSRSGSVDKVDWPEVEVPIAEWTILRLAADFGGLHASPPIGDLTAAGGTLSLRAHGAEPGELIEFRSGPSFGPAAPVGCPDVEGSFANPVVLGSATAGADGVAQVDVAIDAGAVGGVLEYRAIAPARCAVSEFTTHLLITGAQQ